MKIAGFIRVHIRTQQGIVERYINARHISMIHPPDKYSRVVIQVGKDKYDVEETVQEIAHEITQARAVM